ncbi:hypothetical protein BES34_007710 [Leptospira inadai serovar Lyme]|uniref:Uncharacterized protein n=1 Tax=Leptospira inadai serovar Lyme TaxID=293084 RepID=A0ABX4YKA6_9LEPT|nr:hypothetical protein BES34_007710 [Leptospira inadai serovar Lyme]
MRLLRTLHIVAAFRRQRSEDRRVRFAHARQKLLDVGNAAEVKERSTITQESFLIAWKSCLSMFCLPED